MWDAMQLRDWTMAGFTEHPNPAGRSLFRLETLDAYGVASDGSDYQRYLDGEPGPDPQRMGRWLDRVRTEKARGLDRSRVHMLSTPLAPYLRFECDWAYAYNTEAGERVAIIDRTETELSETHRADLDVGDFWLLEAPGETPEAVVMHYDPDGGFIGADRADDPWPYVAAADTARILARPFTSWWAGHPAEHRENRHAA